MNWEAIGAIGEIAGSMVVFFTLVVLIRQIREGTNANRATTLESIGDRIQQRVLAQATDPALAALHVRAASAQSLAEFTDVEQHQLKYWWFAAFNHQQIQFSQMSLGATRKQDNEFRTANFVRQLQENPIAMECWQLSVQRRSGFNLREEFVDVVEQALGHVSTG